MGCRVEDGREEWRARLDLTWLRQHVAAFDCVAHPCCVIESRKRAGLRFQKLGKMGMPTRPETKSATIKPYLLEETRMKIRKRLGEMANCPSQDLVYCTGAAICVLFLSETCRCLTASFYWHRRAKHTSISTFRPLTLNFEINSMQMNSKYIFFLL